jgi:pantothenate kinase
MTFVVGLTGNIGSGKSTAAQRFAALGATVIDADLLSRQVVEAGTPALKRIADRWGSSVLAPDGLLDRAALRRRVFHDQTELEELNRIVHPAVTQLRSRLPLPMHAATASSSAISRSSSSGGSPTSSIGSSSSTRHGRCGSNAWCAIAG